MIFQRRFIRVTSLAGLLFMAPTGPILHAQETHFRSQFWRSKAKVIIPFEYFRNQIVVKLSLNDGPPANFLVDSGSDHTLLSQRAVETAHLKTNAVKGEVNSLAGRCHLNLTVGGVHIRAGKNELVHGSMPVIDLTAWETELGIPLEGIIGFDYIRQFPILVGYSAKTDHDFCRQEAAISRQRRVGCRRTWGETGRLARSACDRGKPEAA